ncbi:uncharacterized protein LOC120215172 [Hibiscus syriacus]|uniref:uncharacterized protein LOC120215172 n=1 Tax=Hibiscus syriacus TaxID=106335 RepID=UPI001920F19D|nr:uncharacterized protein LOC120215172 [Hibiscus syriacus]
MGANRDQSQSALVSFRQPCAYQAALLLNNAIFAGQPIRVLPKKDDADPPVSYRTIPIVYENNKTRGNIPVLRAVADALGCEGVQLSGKTTGGDGQNQGSSVCG